MTGAGTPATNAIRALVALRSTASTAIMRCLVSTKAASRNTRETSPGVLIALDAQVDLSGPEGLRRIPFASLHTPPNGHPDIETTLRSGEVISSFMVPAGAWTRRSLYVKVRDRTSYEFAIASAAVALEMKGETVLQSRIGLGGMAYRPWRSQDAEQVLAGKPLTEANAEAAAARALQGAKTHGHNDYKPELARRTLVRALLQAKATSIAAQGA